MFLVSSVDNVNAKLGQESAGHDKVKIAMKHTPEWV